LDDASILVSIFSEPRHVRVTWGELDGEDGTVHLTVHAVEETPRCPSQSAPWVEKGPPARRIEWRSAGIGE
jgi:hypothetical protein